MEYGRSLAEVAKRLRVDQAAVLPLNFTEFEADFLRFLTNCGEICEET